MFPFAYTATYLAADDTNSSPAYHVVPFKQDTIQDTIYLSLLNLGKSHLHEWSGAIFEGYTNGSVLFSYAGSERSISEKHKSK